MPNNKVYLIYKSIGPSSFACVNQLRRSLGADKAGHIGTLDPFAEGLLPVFVDRATRLIPYLEEGQKTYRALVLLGADSKSLDANGSLNTYTDLDFATYYSLLKNDADLIKEKLAELIGESQQEIPLYSAKKVQGRKMYEYARANRELAKQYKTVTVTEAKLLDWQGLLSKEELNTLSLSELEALYKTRFKQHKHHQAWLYPTFFPIAKKRLQNKKLTESLTANDLEEWCKVTPALYLYVEFTVSKGTFIRALVSDLGKRLHTTACTLRLLRTKVGNFTLEAARSEAEWQDLFADVDSIGEKLSSLGQNLQTVFATLPRYTCSEKEYRWLLQGRTLTFYPKNKAKNEEYSTHYLWKKLINLASVSIIKQEQFVLATYADEVIALLRFQKEQIADDETASISLVPERILFSHEDL